MPPTTSSEITLNSRSNSGNDAAKKVAPSEPAIGMTHPGQPNTENPKMIGAAVEHAAPAKARRFRYSAMLKTITIAESRENCVQYDAPVEKRGAEGVDVERGCAQARSRQVRVPTTFSEAVSARYPGRRNVFGTFMILLSLYFSCYGQPYRSDPCRSLLTFLSI